MTAWVWAANLCGWPILQIGIAYWILRRPATLYQSDSWLTRSRPWEGDGSVYRKLLLVHRWKRYLPEGAVWLNRPRDQRLILTNRSDIPRFLAETRRAERAHWYMLFCTPLFFLWNPLWACAVMALYGVLTNLPCILAQRFNRLRVQQAMNRRPALFETSLTN